MRFTINAHEYNFDGLIGPTHNFAGLAFGNLASKQNRYAPSNPKAAALQGLKKMKLLHDLGIKQGILPPHERPDLNFLKGKGFTGSDNDIIAKSFKSAREHLLISYSASSMWSANAATVSPSIDCENKHLHMTSANLLTQEHRSIESSQTAQLLKHIFPDEVFFIHHPPLPDDDLLFDEGAANHLRLCERHDMQGVEVFVYGKNGTQETKVYPARQSYEASRAISLAHQLSSDHVVFAQQNPQIIDLGVFHNDVISVSNENVLLYHAQAFVDTPKVIEEIQSKFKKISTKQLCLIKITNEQLSVEEAVRTYFFNSQIVTRSDGGMSLIAPEECQDKSIKKLIDSIIADDSPIDDVHFVNLNESMRNGGGPACLRLRIVLTQVEQGLIHKGCVFDADIYKRLEKWINNHYRDKLEIDDLGDGHLLKETRQALDELTQILNLGSIYSFQKS